MLQITVHSPIGSRAIQQAVEWESNGQWRPMMQEQSRREAEMSVDGVEVGWQEWMKYNCVVSRGPTTRKRSAVLGWGYWRLCGRWSITAGSKDSSERGTRGRSSKLVWCSQGSEAQDYCSSAKWLMGMRMCNEQFSGLSTGCLCFSCLALLVCRLREQFRLDSHLTLVM